MKRRTRYTLIAVGAVFFLITAPLIVFYVGGIHYSLDNGEYGRTGILAVSSNPDNAEIYLDGELRDKTSTNFRFLGPREYTLTLKKPGYFDWTKRLEVKAGRATIGAGNLKDIYLLRKDVAPVLINEGVTEYYAHGNVLVYLTNSSLNVVRDNNFGQTQTLALSHHFDSLTASANGNYLVLGSPGQTMLFNLSTLGLTDITALVKNTAALQVTDNGLLVGFSTPSGSSLIVLDPTTGKTLSTRSNIASFAVQNQNLYYTQTEENKTILALIPLAASDGAQPQVISEQLPQNLARPELLVTAQKDVLVLADDNLYRVNSQLDLIAFGITHFVFDPTGSLIYSTASDLYWYAFAEDKSHLITRNTQTLASAQMAPTIGYAFYLQDGFVRAMELDTTDHQNNYSLTPAIEGKSLRLHGDNKSLYLLDGQRLLLVAFR